MSRRQIRPTAGGYPRSGAPKANNDPYQQLLIENPSKGLNNLISNNLIDDKESPSLMNIKFIEAGAPSKADGYTQLGNSTTNNPRGLGYYFDQPNSQSYIMTVDGANLVYRQSVSSGAWTTLAGATFDTSSTIYMQQVMGNLYIWDGVNGGAVVASGLTLSRPGTMPKAKFSVYYNGGSTHACAGVTGQESRLYLSPVGSGGAGSATPSQFTNSTGTLSTAGGVPGATVFANSGAQFIDIQPNDGDKITGLAIFQNSLIIFKEKSIFQMTIDSTGTPVVTQITQAYGCVSFKSVRRVDNDVFFLTRNGFYVLGYEPNYFAVIRTNELSARIHPIIETINPLYFNNAAAIFHQYVYYCSIPSSGGSVNNLTLTYDRRYQAWSQYNHIVAESFAHFTDPTTNTQYVCFTSANSKQVFYINFNTFSAAGSAISCYWYSKSYDLGDFNVFKRWVDCTIFFRQLSGTVTVTFIGDNGSIIKSFGVGSESVSGIGSYMFGGTTGVGSGPFYFGGNPQSTSSDLTTSTNNVPLRFRLSTKSRTMQIKVENANLNENFVVLGIALRYRMYSPFSWPSSLKIQ